MTPDLRAYTSHACVRWTNWTLIVNAGRLDDEPLVVLGCDGVLFIPSVIRAVFHPLLIWRAVAAWRKECR